MKTKIQAIKVTGTLLRKWPLPDPLRSESKEDRGRVLVVGGSRQTPGAVRLAAVAALRSGAGKLQVASGEDVAIALAMSIPEAKVLGLGVDRSGQIRTCGKELLQACRTTDALLVGPGMEDSATTARVAGRLLGATGATTVLDAGALRAYGAPRTSNIILTPHLGEMASITGISPAKLGEQLPAFATEFAREHSVTLVLKGRMTCIASPDGRAWIHAGGSVGLGTSGSGDVLAGVIVGLVARGASPDQAAVWGVWLHGRAGRNLSRQGLIGFLAREIAGEIPGLF